MYTDCPSVFFYYSKTHPVLTSMQTLCLSLHTNTATYHKHTNTVVLYKAKNIIDIFITVFFSSRLVFLAVIYQHVLPNVYDEPHPTKPCNNNNNNNKKNNQNIAHE